MLCGLEVPPATPGSPTRLNYDVLVNVLVPSIAVMRSRGHGHIVPGFVATERVAADGLPKPFQISVESAATEALRAIEAERRNACFPRSMATLVRGLAYVTTTVRNQLLRRLAR